MCKQNLGASRTFLACKPSPEQRTRQTFLFQAKFFVSNSMEREAYRAYGMQPGLFCQRFEENDVSTSRHIRNSQFFTWIVMQLNRKRPAKCVLTGNGQKRASDVHLFSPRWKSFIEIFWSVPSCCASLQGSGAPASWCSPITARSGLHLES